MRAKNKEEDFNFGAKSNDKSRDKFQKFKVKIISYCRKFKIK